MQVNVFKKSAAIILLSLFSSSTVFTNSSDKLIQEVENCIQRVENNLAQELSLLRIRDSNPAIDSLAVAARIQIRAKFHYCKMKFPLMRCHMALQKELHEINSLFTMIESDMSRDELACPLLEDCLRKLTTTKKEIEELSHIVYTNECIEEYSSNKLLTNLVAGYILTIAGLIITPIAYGFVQYVKKKFLSL